MLALQDMLTMFKNQLEKERQFNPEGQEFWSARSLAPILGYINWEQVPGLIERATAAAENAGANAPDHFRPASKKVSIGSNSTRDVLDFHMSRYGCYLFALNGDPRKPEISCAQSYFVVKTHQMESAEALALATPPPALPTAYLVGMAFLQQFAGNVVVAIQQQAETTKAELREEITLALGERPISGGQPRAIQNRIRTLAGLMGGQRVHYSNAWRQLKTRYGLASYRDLRVDQFEDALHFLDLQAASYQPGAAPAEEER